MKSKEKNIKITVSMVVLILLVMVVIYYNYSNKEITYASTIEEIPVIKISNASEINLDEIILKNTENNIKEEIINNEEELEYITTYKNNSDLPKGEMKVIQEGRNGKQEITIKRIYKDDIIISEEQIASKVTKSSINKIVEVGTSKYASKQEVKKGDILYVTADRVSVMSDSSLESNKLTTLTKNSQVTFIEKKDDWYKISCKSISGWVNSEYVRMVNQEKEENNLNNKGAIAKNISFDMSLNKPSGLTLEQFKTVLTDAKDTNKIFSENAEYFYYIEEQYNINGIFVAAVGIHESNWGTSRIAKNKYNLFGYGAYDSNPYNGAYTFSNYSESIDLIARVFVKYYLNPKGTKIYDGEIATGQYYNGDTLSDVNKKYATDTNWAKSVYKYMEYLYKK